MMGFALWAFGLARAAGAWLVSFIQTPLGRWVTLGLIIVVAVILFGNARYAAGDKHGAARVQATIDKPFTGWKARLDQCHDNNAVLDASLTRQSAQIKAVGEISAQRLAEAERGLADARRANAKAQEKFATIMKPLVGADTCLRVIEADERLLESLK